MPPITVAIVEDNAEIRTMLTEAVAKAADLSFVGSFGDGESALERLANLAPQVVIMDIQLPGIDGIECTRRLKQTLPATQVLVFTVFADSEQVFNALAAGASGYLLKRTTRRQIAESVRQVWEGGAPMSGEIARKVVESFHPALGNALQPAQVARGEIAQLTSREEEVLRLLAKGYVTKEIAEMLSISFDTVRFHLKNIYAKLHVRSRTEALVKFLR
jgi:DNA-binding NarL/FixJ family response regulator